MADRFDLEEKIMRASWVLEDIRLLRNRYNQRDFTWDELDNFLMALETVYQHRFDDLEDMMCQVFKLNQYSKQPQSTKELDEFYTKLDQYNKQPQSTKELDEFYKEVEANRKIKPDLMSTFDEKM